MPFNGSGVFQRVRNWVADAAAGIKVRADYHDSEDDGFATGLTNCITKDGQTIITQNIPFNSKRATGLQDPVNPQDAATKAYTDTKVGAGGVITGDMTISKDAPILILDDTDEAGVRIVGQHDGKNRWIMRLGNDDPETGTGNVGSNFDLLRYADDGTTLLGKPLVIDRATSIVKVNGDLYSYRSATEGVIYLSGDGTHYLHWSGTNYSMPNGKLTLGGAGETAVTRDQLNTKQPNLGYTPVRQGGSSGMLDNTVYIGWDNAKLLAQVDGVPLGAFMFGSATAVTGGRLAIASDVLVVNTGANVMYEPYGGAVITGWQWTSGGGFPIITVFRLRWVQMLVGGIYYTVGISN